MRTFLLQIGASVVGIVVSFIAIEVAYHGTLSLMPGHPELANWLVFAAFNVGFLVFAYKLSERRSGS